jgi:hypothetical protein
MKLLTTVAALAVLLSASSAFAVDNKAYSGSTCKPSNSASPYNIFFPGFIQNTAAGTVNFDCPIIRDEVGGVTPFNVQVFVFDNSAALTLSCTARSIDPNGVIIGTFNANTGAPAFTGAATLSLTVNPTGAAVGNFYNLQCALPSGAQIRAYRVVENEQID